MRSLIAVLLLGLATRASAQLPHEEYRGATAVGLALRELATTKRVLVIAAHPDDEDSQLISVLSAGHGADVAYLSLTRGEGGQNSIGSELGPALGLLRTGELLAAREMDRAQQFFTRAYDFGYSKTSEETLRHWPKDSILSDVVAVVRRYRPDIIVAVFSGTPSDGHGHHQVSGILAREAFSAAADPQSFPEQLRAGLRVHRTLKLFQSANFRGTPTHRLPAGELDPLIGRSYAQLAAASRSRHRSQDFGALQALGPRPTALALLQSNSAMGANGSIFSGIDTTLSARATSARESSSVVKALQRYDSLVTLAQQRLSPYSTSTIVPLLSAALAQLDATAARAVDVRAAVAAKKSDVQHAIMQAAGIVVDAVTSVESIVPGQEFALDVSVWNASPQPLEIVNVTPDLPASWQLQRMDSASDALAAGALVTRRYRVRPPPDAALSQPYFLAAPRIGDSYPWPTSRGVTAMPFDSPAVRVSVVLDHAGVRLHDQRPATRRIVDQRQGELRRAVHVVPAFVLKPAPTTALVTLAAIASQATAVDVAVEVRSNGKSGHVTVAPQLPTGWRAVPAQAPVTIDSTGEPRSVKFALAPPHGVAAGSYSVRFVATDASGRTYDLVQHVVDYPHIVNHVYFEPAQVKVTVLDARFARGMRVGYVVGMDAPVPPVLEQLGLVVDQLDEKALATGDLSRYDAIVVGSRAYEVRRDLVAHNGRILDYGRRGGNVVVMYQQYEFVQGNYAPYALTISRPHDRVTDENAPVRLLAPDAAALNKPNRITQSDFADWVQERALYMPRTWAPEYKPLLEMTDFNEEPRQSAILTAALGKGYYTYTAIPFFRQVPAAVPGALRLFINLLSLGIRDAAL